MNRRLCKVGYRKNLYLLIVILISLQFIGIFAEADDGLEVVEQYSPIFYFEGDEKCFPVDASYHIENANLYRFLEDGKILVTDDLSTVNLSYYTNDDYILDNGLGTVYDNNIINDYQSKIDQLGYTVYYRSVKENEIEVIQYWMFYAFNKGELNQHEGDWEMVQVVLSNGIPTECMYSQHHGGQKASWDQVEKESTHIKVYVARGSHANYLRSFSGKFGIASDIVAANGFILNPGEYNLVSIEEHDWSQFGGRWGEFNSYEDILRGKAGPQGPKFRENGVMWNNPIVWGNSLTQSIDLIFFLEWFLYYIVIIFLLIALISFVLIGFRIFKRYKKTGLGPRIVSMLYIDGINLKSIGNIVTIIGIIVAFIALFNPWYSVSTNISLQEFNTQGMVKLVSVDGLNGIMVNFLDPNSGPVQLGALSLPFSLFIAIGIAYLVIATIGISNSKKLGKKYIFRGIKLIVPIIFIIIVVLSIGFVIDNYPLGELDPGVEQIFGSITSSPLGGQKTVYLNSLGGSEQISINWGLDLGGQLLILSSVMLIIAGIIEIFANSDFYLEKTPSPSKNIQNKEKLV
ncbi:MAG: Vps62-related protein [Candidatus Thermoplasmatota archaeon]|nr:Vps62-related protein [Candidatus Thermoplasmatota archaeon]